MTGGLRKPQSRFEWLSILEVKMMRSWVVWGAWGCYPKDLSHAIGLGVSPQISQN